MKLSLLAAGLSALVLVSACSGELTPGRPPPAGRRGLRHRRRPGPARPLSGTDPDESGPSSRSDPVVTPCRIEDAVHEIGSR